jgi:hypothetical protein
MKVKTVRNRIRAYQPRAYLLVIIVCVLIPTQLFAQTRALRVTLHDIGGAGLAGVSIIVRAEGGQELARQTTGGDGAASFDDLPGVVLVAVEGQPRGGPRLYQLGADLEGVRVVLDTSDAPLTLDLGAERDGLVLPDPATMLSLEEGGPIVVETSPIPTAAIATPAPLPTSPRTTITPASTTAADDAPPYASWVPLVTVLIVAVAAVVLMLIQRRRSAL